MNLKSIIQPVFNSLINALLVITDEQYTKPCAQLNGSSIGAHTRHIIELFRCLTNGYDIGVVNYDDRKRNILIQADKEIAINLLTDIVNTIIFLKNKEMVLQLSIMESDCKFYIVNTNFYREFIYNLEHTIHHMAFIRIGIFEVGSIVLPQDFGVASSTIQYNRSCVQ